MKNAPDNPVSSRNGKYCIKGFVKGFVRGKVFLLLFLSIMFVFQTGSSSASWVDDWMQQKTSSNPGYFEGQKRGYFTGGSFQGRWKEGTDNLISIQKPRIKAGCGGIDISMGGFSFLDFEYIVQKLQRILQNAAGFAFHLGLKVLSQEAGSTLEWIEGVSDALNHIQLDDCKAGKAIVAYTGDAIMPGSRFSNEFQQAQSDFRTSTGLGTLFDKFKIENKTNFGDPGLVAGDSRAMLSGCPADVRDLFNNSSFLAGLGAKIAADQKLLSLVRGIIGDVQIDVNDGVPFATLVAPCGQNEPDSLDQILNGTVRVRDSVGSSCTEMVNASGNIRDRVAGIMSGLAVKYKARQTLNSNEQLFVDNSPLAISMVLKTAVGTSQEAVVIGQLSDITAKAYTYNLLMDLYGRIYHALGVYSNIISSKQGGNSDSDCYLELLNDVVTKANSIKPRLDTLISHTKAEYAKVINETNSIYNLVGKLREFSQLAQDEIARVSGEPAARKYH